MYFDYVIIGAGLSAITLAERISIELNKSVLIIEKGTHIGGSCYDFYDSRGTLKPKYGIHIFYTNMEHIWRYLSNFTKWIYVENYNKSFRHIGVPNKGYTNMFFKMINGNVKLLLNTDYKDVINDIKYEELIYTGNIDYFFDYRFGVLDYMNYNTIYKYNKYIEKAKKEKNVTFIGRWAEYKYYTMDRIVDRALKIFYRDIWK